MNPIPHLGALIVEAVADAGGAAAGSLLLSINIARDSSLGNRRPSQATVVMETVINKREAAIAEYEAADLGSPVLRLF